LQAFFAEFDEEVEGLAPVGHRELGQQDPAELELDVAALGDLERAAKRVVVAGEVAGHLGGCLEEEVIGSRTSNGSGSSASRRTGCRAVASCARASSARR